MAYLLLSDTQKKLELLVSLMLLSFVPSIYETVKVFFISVSGSSASILGQLEWYDLIDETLRAFLITPMYFLLAPYIEGQDREKAREAIFSVSAVIFLVYALFSVASFTMASTMLEGMSFTGDIAVATRYLSLETLGFVIGIMPALYGVVFVLIGKPRYIYALLAVKLLSSVVGDAILMPVFQEMGTACTSILSNIVCFVLGACLLHKESLFYLHGFSMGIFRKWGSVGLFSGMQILINNLVYALVIVRMVNEVSEAGNYWVANNFIWGWLLVPAMALSEIIKRDCAETGIPDWKFYHVINASTIILWLLTMPLWHGLFASVFNIEIPDTILSIVLPLIPFYVVFVISYEIESVFVGMGKTQYPLLVSCIVNFVYYGIMAWLFAKGWFSADMEFIEYLFGFGMVFGLAIYILLLFLGKAKKEV